MMSARRSDDAIPVAGLADGPAQTVAEAEVELALLYRRMLAHLRNPRDTVTSRIADDAGFEDCLDLALGIHLRVAELCGEASPAPSERERIRGQILEGLLIRSRAIQPPAARPVVPSAPLAPSRRRNRVSLRLWRPKRWLRPFLREF